MKPVFKGAACALITPMRGGAVDTTALARLIERQIEGGISAIVSLGTTGEASTLSREEKKKVISQCIKSADSRVPVIVGCASTSTALCAEYAADAQGLGADAILALTPFYNKASDEGIYLHYKYICESINIPLIAYNVPKRTGVNIKKETYKSLLTLRGFSGVKEASGDVSACAALLSEYKGLPLYSGCDELTAPLYSLGASGVISVAANILPERVAELCRYCDGGDMEKAREISSELFALNDALFSEVNPIPVKCALSMMGLCTEEMRLPLSPLSAKKRRALAAVLKNYSLV